MLRLSVLLMTIAPLLALAAAEDSVVPPKEVVERLKRQIGDRLLKFKPGQVGPRLHGLTPPLAGGACSVRMPRADAGGGGGTAADPKMVLPLDPEAVREQYPAPRAAVPAPECPAK